MKVITAITLATVILAAGMLVRSVVVAAGYRRRGESMPPHSAGNVASACSLLLLLSGTMVPDHDRLQWVLVIGALVCLSIDVIQTRRAYRNV